MQKILLIIQREYLTRIRKKIFWVATLLLPLFYFLLIFGQSYLAEKTKKNYNIALIDNSGFINASQIVNTKEESVALNLITDTANIAATYKEKKYDGYIVVPAFNWENGAKIIYKGEKTPSLMSSEAINRKMNGIWDKIKEEKLGITNEKQLINRTSILKIDYQKESGEASSSGIASIIAYVCGLLIYLILMIYGSQVMLGVMEEKTNRIAEVIVSSVKPFQLMMGKIMGIGLVALTQFLLWIAFIFIAYNIGKSTGNVDNSAIGSAIGQIQNIMTTVNIPLVIFCFIFYFMGGFFFYASLYAAIASVVNEDVKEAQSLSMPITMLVIFSIVLLSSVISDPTGPIAVWGSMIPFSSPILMLARIPFGVPSTVPIWQLLLSMAFLIVGFIFTTWISAKIYRTGILMYGKKVSFREMLKWIRRN
jgi:ABC-2 type transport system permease protein